MSRNPTVRSFSKPEVNWRRPVTLPVPRVDAEVCDLCGQCGEICEFSAIVPIGTKVLVFPQLCHSCGGCRLVCPLQAITEIPREVATLMGGRGGWGGVPPGAAEHRRGHEPAGDPRPQGGGAAGRAGDCRCPTGHVVPGGGGGRRLRQGAPGDRADAVRAARSRAGDGHHRHVGDSAAKWSSIGPGRTARRRGSSAGAGASRSPPSCRTAAALPRRTRGARWRWMRIRIFATASWPFCAASRGDHEADRGHQRQGGHGQDLARGVVRRSGGTSVLADCDVDAADLHLVVRPSPVSRHDFIGGKRAVIDGDAASTAALCRTSAGSTPSSGESEDRAVDPIACEGCGVCAWFCPERAIDLVDAVEGEWYSLGDPVWAHGPRAAQPGRRELGQAGQPSSGRGPVDRRGVGSIDTVLIDGSPGIGCPVIASITGADLVLVVTEPTLSGLHDLRARDRTDEALRDPRHGRRQQVRHQRGEHPPDRGARDRAGDRSRRAHSLRSRRHRRPRSRACRWSSTRATVRRRTWSRCGSGFRWTLSAGRFVT